MRRRVGFREWLWNYVQDGERRVIRVMVIASVILVVMQLSVVRDPLQFYISVASKVESPPLDLPSPVPSEPVKTWQLTLKAVPAAPIRVVQNGKVIATLSSGMGQITAQPGQLLLDGTKISQTVRVQVIKRNGQNEPIQTQVVVPPGTTQVFVVSP